MSVAARKSLPKQAPIQPKGTIFLRSKALYEKLNLRHVLKRLSEVGIGKHEKSYQQRSFGRRCKRTPCLPQKQGLYRILSHVWSELARERGLLINASAGVGAFKKSRGAIPALESNMVYAAHTPGPRRCWGLLGALLDRVAVPIIVEKEL